MSSQSGSSSFPCPKCLGMLSVRMEQAGTRIDCPSCGASLVVPQSFANEDLFDDLFDENSKDGKQRPKPISRDDDSITISDESAFDTGLIEDMTGIIGDAGTGQQTPADAVKSEPKNPFDYDETKNLRIEGVSPDVKLPGSFFFKCPICESELNATENQVGETVKCGDCYAEVKVAKPKKSKFKDPWRQPAKLMPDDPDEIKLEPSSQLPKNDHGIDKSIGLNDVTDDLLAPREFPERGEPTEKAASKNESLGRAAKSKPLVRKKSPAKRPVAARPSGSSSSEKRFNRQTSVASKQLPENSGGFKQLLSFEFAKDIDLLIRTIVSVIFLTFAYAMIDSVVSIMAKPELSVGEKFVDALPAAIGALACISVVLWFVAITVSVLMRASANGLDRVDEWIGFAPSEWFGNFAVVTFSLWSALLPGVLFGYVAWKVTGFFALLPIAAAISGFALVPVFLTSSFYNESVFNIFSAEIIQSISSQNRKWIDSYQTFALAMGVFILGTLFAFIPGIFFCFIAAVIQIVSTTVFAVLVGQNARRVINNLS